MVVAILRPEKYGDVKSALREAGIMGMTFTHVTGRGAQAGLRLTSRAGEISVDEIDKVKLEIVVESDEDVDRAVDTIRRNACTGHHGDGRIFVLPVERSLKISGYSE